MAARRRPPLALIGRLYVIIKNINLILQLMLNTINLKLIQIKIKEGIIKYEGSTQK